MDQIRNDGLSIWRIAKILVALALGPAVMAAILVMVVVVAPLALVIGIPYYFLAKEIHHALVDKNPGSPYLAAERSCACAPTKAASDSQSLIPVHSL